jgi:hypothetical protein
VRRDQLANVSAVEVAEVARSCISITQSYPPQTIVAGLCLTFVLLCEHMKVRPSWCLEVCANVLKQFHKTDPGNLRGLKRYLTEEIPNHD